VNSTRLARFASIAALAALALAGLTGCAETPAGAEGGSALSLSQIKSPVQLLRNEVASRIPGNLVVDVVQPNDRSEPCETIEADPNGLSRTWKSSILILINFHSKTDIEQVVENIVESYEEDGWVSAEGESSKITQLTNPKSFVTIDLSSVKPDKVAEIGGQVQVTTAGSCVTTEGRAAKSVTDLGPAI